MENSAELSVSSNAEIV